MEQNAQRSIEMDDDPRQQDIEWVIQRIAWLLLTALLVAVALGLFGRGGPFSKVGAMAEDGSVRVEYQRFLRYHSPDVLQVSIEKAASRTVRLRMDSQYARHIQIERITPDPQQELGEDGAVTYLFNVQPGAKVDVSFHFAPEKYGKLDGWISLDNGSRLPFAHFVYP